MQSSSKKNESEVEFILVSKAYVVIMTGNFHIIYFNLPNFFFKFKKPVIHAKRLVFSNVNFYRLNIECATALQTSIIFFIQSCISYL